jgi:chemotaxis protein CheD
MSTLPASGPLLVAGIGEMVLSADPNVTLVAYGLGSCVALVAWDSVAHVGGLAHFMLPSGQADGLPVKFVDAGLPTFLRAFRSAGGHPQRSELKAVGGAAMLALASNGLEIGRRNADAVLAALDAAGLRLHASELGGKSGRTVQLSVGTGRLLVKSIDVVREL